MNSLLLAEAGVFNRMLESQSLIVVIVIMIVGFLFMRAMKSRNDAMVGDTFTKLRGDSIAQDLFEAILVAAVVWFVYPIIPWKSPLDTSVPAATKPVTGTLVMKAFPTDFLPVWKENTVTFTTATPNASLGIGQFWVVAFKPSNNLEESWMKGYKVKPDRAGIYTLPEGVTAVRVYADTEGIGVRTYVETLTKKD